MSENNKIPNFITFPKTFEKYKWYKPILVFIIGLIIYIIFNVIVDIVFNVTFGTELITSIANGGYEALNSEVGQIYTDLGIIVMIPAIYLAAKLIRDRPFSSYASSRRGWNHKLYFKSLILPLIMYIILEIIGLAIDGPENGTFHFTVPFFILCLITVPLQCIAEEYVFRGLLLQTFGSWFKFPIIAIVLQAIAFAALHGYNTFGIIQIFISGLIYGFFTWKTNGIEVSSAIHTMNNLTITIFVMLGIQLTSSSPEQMDVLISIIVEIVMSAIIYYVGVKTNWFGELTENEQT